MNEELLWPCGCIAVGLGLLILGVVTRRKLENSKSWPKTAGTIIESKIESEWAKMGGSFNRTYIVHPKVVYKYRVAEKEYTSSQLALVELDSADSDLAQSKAEKYKAGQKVVVYYDPLRPEFATLRTGDPTGGKLPFGLIIFGSIAVIAGIVWILMIKT